MKLKILSLILILALSFGGCTPASPKAATAEKPAAQQKIQYWTCSMHPQVHMDHPGKCPICGMNLVSVMQEETSTAMPAMDMAEVKLNSAQNSVASVAVSPAKKDFLNKTLTVFGEIAFIQDKHVDFTWVYGGRIERVVIPYSTTDVQKGQPLVEVYSEEAIADEQMYLQAVRDRYLTTFYERKVASSQVELYRQKLLRAGMTEPEMKALVNKKKIKTTFTLTAPISGSIVGMLPAVGERFTSDKTLFHLSDISQVWFVGKVYEQDIAVLQPGQKATVRVKSFPGKQFDGTVLFVDRFLDPVSRTLQVRLAVDNPGKLLLPDMAGEAALVPQNSQAVLVIPESAIIDTGSRKIVYVQTAPATYRQQEVTIGTKGQISGSTENFVEITQGLSEGEAVVTAGAFVIDAEAQLKGLSHTH